LEGVHLIGSGRLVLVAEDPEDRAIEVRNVVDGSHGLLRSELIGSGCYATTPQVGHGIELRSSASHEHGIAPARAGADDADFATGIGQRADVLQCAFAISHDAIVGDATLTTDLGRDVIGLAGAGSRVEIGAYGDVTMVCEAPGR